MAFALAGTALLDTGEAAPLVIVRDWDSHAHVLSIVPNEAGSWFAEVASAGPYDLTFRGPVGYQPVCHGPVAAVEG